MTIVPSWNTSVYFRLFCTSRCDRSALRRLTFACWCSCSCDFAYRKAVCWRNYSYTLSICYCLTDNDTITIVEFNSWTCWCLDSYICCRTTFSIKVWSDDWSCYCRTCSTWFSYFRAIFNSLSCWQACSRTICKSNNYWSVCLNLNISCFRVSCLNSCYYFRFFFISKCFWIVNHCHLWSLDAICFLSFFCRNYWFFFRILSSFNFFFSHCCWSYFYSWCCISWVLFSRSWLNPLCCRASFWLSVYCICFDWWSY